MDTIAVARAFECLKNPEVRKATVYLSDKLTVKITRQHKYKKRDRSHTLVLTYGQPNYLEREFIKQCKKAGEPFPVKKVQLRMWPKPKAKKGKK